MFLFACICLSVCLFAYIYVYKQFLCHITVSHKMSNSQGIADIHKLRKKNFNNQLVTPVTSLPGEISSDLCTAHKSRFQNELAGIHWPRWVLWLVLVPQLMKRNMATLIWNFTKEGLNCTYSMCKFRLNCTYRMYQF